MEYFYIGMAAAILGTISLLPQVIKIWKTKKTRDISLQTFVLVGISLSLWLIYGILINDFPLIFANAITLVLASIILFFKFRYK